MEMRKSKALSHLFVPRKASAHSVVAYTGREYNKMVKNMPLEAGRRTWLQIPATTVIGMCIDHENVHLSLGRASRD